MSTPRGGRRIAQVRRRRVDRTAVTSVVLLALAVAAVALTGSPSPERLAGPSSGALVDRTQLACPGAPDDVGRGGRGRTVVALAPVAGPGGPLGDGGAVRVGRGADDSKMPLERGELRALAGDKPVVVDAGGASAVGLFGQRVDQGARATAAARCVAPRADWWFTAAGAGLDHASVLVLRNVDPGPAVVDIRALGVDGEIETVGTRGVTIGPGETTTIPLTDVAPQNDELAVHVAASRGRVAATLTDSFARKAGAPEGLERIPSTDHPARRVRLSGIPSGTSSRTLVVGNPSELEALVDLEVVGSRGLFVPTGFETLSVPPGSVRVLDVTDLLGRRAVGSVRLSAQVPVVAGIRSSGRTDHSYAPTVVPLTDPAAYAVVAGATSTLQLSSGAGGATVEVTGYSDTGEQTETAELVVDPAATRTWKPKSGTDYVVVEPVQGNAYGAVALTGQRGLSAVPLVSLPVRLAVPRVVPAPR